MLEEMPGLHSLAGLVTSGPTCLFAVAHGAEEVHDTGKHNEQDTASGTQSQHLGQETLVQRREALLPHDGAERRPCPVVLGYCACDLGRILDTRLGNIHRGVQDGTNSATDSAGQQIVGNLTLLIGSSGQKSADLEDAAKVASVPQNMPPHGRLETLVEGERAFLLDNLRNAVHHAIVLVRLGLVLQSDLDELEGYDDESLGSAGGSASENGQGLVHLVHAEQIAVERAPRVVCCELGGPRSRQRRVAARVGDPRKDSSAYLLGASMRIGAVIPRYSLEALSIVSTVGALGIVSCVEPTLHA